VEGDSWRGERADGPFFLPRDSSIDLATPYWLLAALALLIVAALALVVAALLLGVGWLALTRLKRRIQPA
jgi:hypothetical protein